MFLAQKPEIKPEIILGIIHKIMVCAKNIIIFYNIYILLLFFLGGGIMTIYHEKYWNCCLSLWLLFCIKLVEIGRDDEVSQLNTDNPGQII